ncbi:MAG: hypothetical protein IJ193_08990 [Bacilli bacterium]|nr:hypothetical protein [Bacilli bacterium]
MRKLNNKGMTTAEILVSFILVSLISSILYTTVSNYNTKRQMENYKLQINTYKNTLTKTIQDDLIKIGVISANIKKGTSGDKETFVINIELTDHTTRRLYIARTLADDYFMQIEGTTQAQRCSHTSNKDDFFELYYGTPKYPDINTGSPKDGLEPYPIPDFGYSLNHTQPEIKNCGQHKIFDLRVTNIRMNTDNKVLTLFIGFSHTQLGTKYAINISCPINYTT